MIPLDYPDMIKSGMATSEGSLRDPNVDKYAVILKTAQDKVGKFPISTPEQVRESIFAVNNNPNIPDLIKKTAMYYIKQAALSNDIDIDWEVDKMPHDILVNDVMIHKQPVEIPMVKLGQNIYRLDTPSSIKIAEEMFLSREDSIEPEDRIHVSELIVKAASLLQHTPQDATIAYAGNKLGSKTDHELTLRKTANRNDRDYVDTLEKLSIIKEEIAPHVFIKAVQLLDKRAEFYPSDFGRTYADFFMDIPNKSDDISKIAESEEDSLLRSII